MFNIRLFPSEFEHDFDHRNRNVVVRSASFLPLAAKEDLDCEDLLNHLEFCRQLLMRRRLHVPSCDPLLAPIIYTIPLQLLSYHVAIIKGTDVDQPRNLAKSVTVE